jgi:hypothetical protein
MSVPEIDNPSPQRGQPTPTCQHDILRDGHTLVISAPRKMVVCVACERWRQLQEPAEQQALKDRTRAVAIMERVESAKRTLR